MLKLGNRFLLEREHFDKFKPWREFAYNAGAASSTHAGIIMVGANDWRGYQNLRKFSRNLGKTGCSFLVTGGCIVIGGAAIETGLDILRGKKLKSQGLGTKAVLDSFAEQRNEVDTLLAQREEAVRNASTLSDWQKKLLTVEGDVLRDIRNLCTMTFADSYIKVKHGLWQRETAKIMAVETASTSSYLGSLNSLLSLTNRDPHQTGAAGIGFLLGGASVVVTPFIVKYAGACGSHKARKRMDKLLGENRVKNSDQLSADIGKLTEIIKTADSSELEVLKALSARQSIYEAQQLLVFDEPPFFAEEERKKKARQFQERVMFSTIIGGSNMARGVFSLCSGYHYFDRPKKFNQFNAIAATTYTAGTGVWLFDLMQQRTREELHARKQKLAKESPETMLRARLDAIDNMENAISVY